MKPKPFTLGRLLDVRHRRQTEHQRVVAEAARRVRMQEERVQALVDRQVASRGDLREFQSRPALDVLSVMRYRTYLAVLGREAGAAAAKVPPLRDELTARREELVEARRAARVLENLRDRQTAAVNRWLRLREQKVLDDLANRQAVTRMRNEP